MKYLGYVLILGALAAGYAELHPVTVVGFALLSTLIYASSRRIYASARRKALKEQPQAGDRNMLLDGGYLFAGQALIMFTAFILGWFFANRVALGAG
jgi:Ser/Thr protein kinase RdoA (MazF antagonist)